MVTGKKSRTSSVLPILLTLGTLLQHHEVHKSYEDDTIQFGQIKVINDFNDSEYIDHFRFKKQHLHILANLLWPRLQPLLEGDNKKNSMFVSICVSF